ncbi:hypothetical protein [Acidithiobacillus ferrooxidans]|uniref:Uncharacterized protein n=1 Tax=Acidithiobacillus ferrooxidans TaxID=920 RepID=A0A2W1KIX0_ACIFR|nr:hypothetical protein [Acidithiobacillus ferrooxidans]MBU2816090.1 hypothetical protein [Acidithiobacillus ferrooxidans]MCR1344039.1 hypothetical protein [Acidithiobacillus ferrooxidans]PZD82415.1 hypothetical protein DN052_05200 [Acidithiobacillus ferrooxidans]QLK41311.1 hypothetical protein FE661_03365 [Acidithiobacillus ferrooxidans]QZT53253.1 hypothetical protein K7B00_03365 [Acidithiobacillus ferrooxidans]
MDMDQVTQAFAGLVFTSVIDVVQQVDPLEGTQLDEHQARVKTVTEDVGNWLKNLSPDAVAFLDDEQPGHEYLPFQDWMPLSDDYDSTAVCAAVQQAIKTIPPCFADRTPIVTYDVVTGAGEYLTEMDDHKMGWLTERAANILLLNL